MNRSKLIPILKTFSKDEIKEFDKFLDSPFFGCKMFVLNFYRELVKFYPEFSESDIDKKKLFGQLYNSRKFNDALMRRMISDLIRYSEEYLIQKNFKNNNPLRSSSLLNELRSRNLGDLFRVRSEVILKKLNNSESIDPYSLLEMYFVNLEVKEFRTQLRDSKMHESYTLSVEVFTVLFLRIIYPYIRHISTFSDEMKSSSHIISSFISNFDNASFLKKLENNDSRFSLYLKMVIYIHKIGTDKNDRKTYYKLNELITINPGFFSKNELKNIFTSIIIFLSYQNENHDNIFLNEIFDLYNKYLKEFHLNEHRSKLQLSFCRNYINLCVLKDETDLLSDFNKIYSDQYPAEYKDDLYNFCEAVYLFRINKFERSLYHASQVNVDREVFKRDIKILKLKNYYELEYEESFYSELDNLRHFYSASNNLRPEIVRKGKKFTTILLSLINIKTGKGKTDKHILKKLIGKEKTLYEKKWLDKKLEELN